MQKYLSLPHLANHYDLHPDTMKKRLKEINIKQDEHFVILGKSVRFNVDKIHEALTVHSQPTTVNDILNSLLI
jgi:hypothetical protein